MDVLNVKNQIYLFTYVCIYLFIYLVEAGTPVTAHMWKREQLSGAASVLPRGPRGLNLDHLLGYKPLYPWSHLTI